MRALNLNLVYICFEIMLLPKNLILLIIPFLLLGNCATKIPILVPSFPKKKGPQLREVLRGQRNIAIFAAKTDPETVKKINSETAANWESSIEAAVSQELSELGYYKIIDISNRKKRLKELAYSQSGLTSETLEIGRDLQANAFLSIRLTKTPEAQCKVEDIENYTTKVLVITARSLITQRAGNVNTGRPTGILYVSFFVEGRLSNVETGQSVTHFYTQTLRIASEAGTRSCTSIYKAFEHLIPNAGREIARNLSPKFLRLSVPLFSKSQDLPSSLKRKVDIHLKSGLQWAESDNMTDAKKEWDIALKKSKNNSGAAMWNLGVYYWHVGNFEEADEYFENLKRKKPHLLDYEKRRVLAIFNREKEEAGVN